MLPGVVSADLNFASGTLLVEYEAGSDPRARIVRAVEASGHGIEPLTGAAPSAVREPPRRGGRSTARSWP